MTITLLTFKSLNPWAYYILFGALGMVIGSFLNVCIYRMPRGESVIWPRSHCTQCGEVLRWLDMIPLVSFVLLKGRCRKCGASISQRYWIVEGVTGVAFILSAMLPTLGEIITACIFSSILIGISGIDLEYFLIADGFIVWGSVLGIICSTVFPIVQGVEITSLREWTHVQGGAQSLLGLMLGSGLGLWLMFWGEKIFKKEAFGFGDVFLLGIIGAFCGWQGAFFALFGGSFIAVLFLVPIMLLERVCGVRIGPRKVLDAQLGQREANEVSAETNQSEIPQLSAPDVAHADKSVPLQFGVAIPFGPWLAIGALVYFGFFKSHFAAFFNHFVEVFLGQGL